MSLAYKCDRCETCFDPYAVEGSSRFLTITEMFAQDGKDLSMNKVAYRYEKRHMCPACSKAFREFWDGGKETKTDEGEKAADISADPGTDRLGSCIDRFWSALGELNDIFLYGDGAGKTAERPGSAEEESER